MAEGRARSRTFASGRRSGDPPGDRAPAGRSRGPGRPARIDRAAITRAVGEMPLEEVTIRSVAERLGVSVPALYHYVSGRYELLRLAAEQSALRMTMPTDHGQHWAVWFHEWADYIYRAFVDDAEFFKQFIDGAVGVDTMADHVDAAIGLCVRQGFSAQEALTAYDLVSECALGAVISDIRDRKTREDDRPMDVEMQQLVLREGDRLPHLRRLLGAGDFKPPSFADRMDTVLAGIAVRRGEDWTRIADLIRAAGVADPGPRNPGPRNPGPNHPGRHGPEPDHPGPDHPGPRDPEPDHPGPRDPEPDHPGQPGAGGGG